MFEGYRFIVTARSQIEAKSIARLKEVIDNQLDGVTMFRIFVTNDQEGRARQNGFGLYKLINGKVIAISERGAIVGLQKELEKL